MAKNLQIAIALKNPELLTKADNVKALSALVAAGTNLVNFSKALKDNEPFWKQFDGLDNADFADPNDLTEDGTDDDDKLETLFQLAAEKRVLLGLQSASEDILKKIIAPASGQPLRAALAADPVATQIGKIHEAPNWDAALENFLSDQVTEDFQREAQRLLLASKIKACTAADIKKVDDLLKAITDANNGNFVLAAKALGVDDISAAKMAHDVVGPLVRAEAAKKSFTVNHVKIFSANYALAGADGKINPYTELNKADKQFIADLPDPYKVIEEKDAASIKGFLGSQYLYAKIAQMEHKEALKIAKTTDVGQLRVILKGDADDVFLDLAVNEQNIVEFRHLAAVRALKIEIERTSDLSALRALIPARTPQIFQSTLESSPSLGFAGEQGRELRSAFKNNTSPLFWLVPAAHVRLSLLTGDVQELQKLIKDEETPKLFRDKYYNTFPIDNGIANAFEMYLDNPDNRFMLRQQALLAVAKSKFFELEPDVLQEILDAENDGTLRPKMLAVLGINDDSAKDLIADSNNELVNKELRAYAKIELVAKSASGKDFNELRGIINTLQEDILVKNILPIADIGVAQIGLAVHLLKKCPADKVADLVKLTQAKNLVEMKAALEELGVKDRAWSFEESIKELREAALPRAIELKIDAASTLGDGARPELLKLFNDFPPEKQQALLANDKLLPAVMNATSAAKFAKMLDIPDSLIAPGTALRAEYDRIILSSRIQNAAIAKILAGMTSLVLTADKVDKINALLNEPTLDLDRNTFIATIEKISTVVSPSDLRSFNESFGLDPLGANNLDGHRAADLIITQFVRNEHIIAKLQGPDSPEKGIYKFIATLNKNEILSQANGQKLVDECKTATSREDLIEKIKAINPAIDAVTLKSFEQKLTQDIYNDLKRPFSQAKFLENATRQTSIDADKLAANAALAELKKLTDVNKGMNSELNRMSNLSAMAWLNPAFQSAAYKNAYAMKQQFTELNDACNVIVTNLEHAQAFFQEKLDSLPSQDAMQTKGLTAKEQQTIDEHRNFLIMQKDGIANDLGIYTKIQTVLQGNPNNPSDSLTGKGVLKMLDEAMSGRPVKFLGYESKCVAYKNSEREKHFRPGYTGVKADPMPINMVLGANTKSYEVDPDNMKLGKDEFFEHTIGSGADEGYFTEEHGPRHQAPHYNPGKSADAEAVDFPVEVKLSPNKFPTSENGKIQYSMAMASRMLAGATPSLENKILLQGADGDKIKHMWTACMAQMMAMGISAGNAQKFITVRCPFFDPAQEMGTFYGLAEGSLYENVYKKSAIMVNQNADIQELTKDMVEAQKDKKEVVSDVKVVNEKFKEAKTVIQEMKDKNAEQDDDTPTIRMR